MNALLAILKRLPALLASLLVLSAAVFWAAHLAPGDPLAAWYGERAERLTAQERARTEEMLGLDDPLPVQYARWLKNALHGDLGVSYKYRRDVGRVIKDRVGNTLLLGGTGFVLIFLLAPALGALCVWYEDRWPDKVLCKLGTVTSCIPEFWLSLLLVLVFSVGLHWLPSSGAWSLGAGGGTAADRLRHLILPLAVVVTGHLWYYAYMLRNMLSEQVRSDYVLTARAIGLDRRRILLRHCLRNVLPSYLGLMALDLPHILGSTYIVEMVFSYPGLGTLTYESARYQDYDLLMALCMLAGAAVMVCGELSQALGGRIDPRTLSAREGTGHG